MVRRVTDGLINAMEKYLPSSYVLALLLSVVVFIAGLVFTDSGPSKMFKLLGEGMFGLLAFTMQMVLVLVTGYALANSPLVVRFLARLAQIPKNRVSAVTFTAFASYIATYIHWGFGLVAGALLAKEVAKVFQGRKVHYPILVAAAYSGNLARGWSSSIFLGPTVPNHAAFKISGLIPMSETLFMPLNVVLTIVLLLVIPLMYRLMVPTEEHSVEIDPAILAADIKTEEDAHKRQEAAKDAKTPAEHLDNSRIVLLVVAALLLVYLGYYFYDKGFTGLDINSIILIFLVAGMFAHGTPNRYGIAIKNAVRTADSMILQFPLYAAIMVMLRDTGMARAVADFFINISTANTLPLMTFLSSSLVNLFIPSGGGLWAVQGPISLQAAAELGASMPATMVGLAWGDTWSSQIQPFWALPLLAIAGLDVKDIMGYCAMIFLSTGAIIMGFLLLM